MRYLLGLAGAFLVFAASFALHIVGGARDQDWLFAIAVILIYFTAAGFPAIAWLLGGRPSGRPYLVAPGALIGLALTVAALRAANDRTFAWWQIPAGLAAVAITSAALYLLAVHWPRLRSISRRSRPSAPAEGPSRRSRAERP